MADYKINYTQSNFTGGIIAAELYGRNDFGKVKTGLKNCVNWTIREAGGLEFRRGTKYVATVPNACGNNFKITSLGSVLLLFASDGIRYLNNGVWTLVSYPTGITPTMSSLQFTELKRKLYYYDGTIKLCEVSLTNGIPSTNITLFDTSLGSDCTISVAVNGTQPTVYVPVEYKYAFSIAKDEDHETLSNLSNTVTANAELTGANSDSEGKGQEIVATITIPSSVATDNDGGKLYIYKKYQGYYYFLTAVDIVSGTTTYTYTDKGELSADTSKSIKTRPSYLNTDGSVTGVNSIADYGQRVFLTITNQGTNVIFTSIGDTDTLAYSKLRNEDEAGYLEVPVSNFDSWCKVVSGLDLIFSTSYTVNRVSGYGELQLDTIVWDGMSKTVDPVRTRRSLIYTNTVNRNIYDLTYNEYGQYDSIDLTLLVKYIFEDKTIKRLTFKDYPVKTIYVLCSDGELYCLTYIKDQNIYAWYKLSMFNTVYDIVVVNNDTEDDIYMVIKDGSTYQLVKAYYRTDNIYMDNVIPVELTSITNNVITGLSALEGHKVRVFDLGNNLYYGDYDIQNPKTIVEGGNVKQIDDLDFNGYTVTNGQITLPSSITLTGNVLVGIPYYAVMETISLEFSDQNGNSTIGRKKTINHAYLRYGDSRGISYKTLGKEFDCGVCKKDMSDTAEFLERGQVRLETNSEYKWDSTIKILQRQPYPARIESITLGITFNDKS